MIIKSKPLPLYVFKLGSPLLNLYFKRRYNKMIIKPTAVKPGCSYILMCNHFGFLDGFLAAHLLGKTLVKSGDMKSLYIMSLKKQMQKNPWLRYMGSFSVDPGRRSVTESLDYAAEILSQPGNVLLFFPQGKLESCHIRHIQLETGIVEIVPKIKGNCQLLWSSNLIEYFESSKPSIYFNMADMGDNHNFDFEILQEKVNHAHRAALEANIRFTDEPYQIPLMSNAS